MMIRKNSRWYLACFLTAMALMMTVSAQAEAAIVTSNLVLSLDAGNAGNGVGVLGSGNSWQNQSGTAINHDATLVGFADWAGTGTPVDPFRVEFRNDGGAMLGYASVNNSAVVGSDLDLTVFTYEIWADVVGAGVGDPSNLEVGTLMGHHSYDPEGNGSISYTSTKLLTAGGTHPGTDLPGSTGPNGAGMQHIVLSRAGGGATDTTWYLNGVLQGTAFMSDSAATDPTFGPFPFTIGARKKWFSTYSLGANADIAQVRVYSAPLSAAEVLQNFNTGLTQFVIYDPADFNNDGFIDGGDLTKWEGDYGVNGNSDADGDGDSDGNDFLIWQRSLTSPLSSVLAVPEPSTFGLLTFASFGFALLRKPMV